MLRLFIIALLSLATTACTIKPATDYLSSHDFSQYKSFAFVASPAGVPESIDSARIKSAVVTHLKPKGLEQTDISDADLQVAYRIEDETELEQSGITTSFGFSRSHGGIAMSTPAEFNERKYGKLVLEFLDPTSQSIVWKSISQKQLHETISTEQRTEFINNEIILMLNAYPPKIK